MNLNLGRIFFDNDFTDFITIGGNSFITMYAVFLAIGIVVGALLAFKEAKKLGIAKTHIMDGLLLCTPIALLVGRLAYIIFRSGETGAPEALWWWEKVTHFIDFQDGIMVPFVLLTVVIFVVVFGVKTKINTLKIFDVIIPSILIIQIFGKLGSLFGGGLLGQETTSEFLSTFMLPFFVEKCNVGGVYYHPLFLYEGVWLALGLVLIAVTRRLKTKLQVGDFIGFYLLWYGFGSLVIVEIFQQSINVFAIVMACLTIIAGIAFIVVKHIKFGQKNYFESLNEIREKSLQCYVFDLDQTIIKADNLVNTAYGETLTKNHGLTVYDDPQLALDPERLKRYVQFTKENHELLTEMYRGVKVTFDAIKAQGNEIVIISKLPADVIALKISHYGLNKYVNRFINSNDIAKLGQQYNPFSIMVFSSDRRILNFSYKNGFKTAYAKYANEDTTGVVADEILNRFSDALYLV